MERDVGRGGEGGGGRRKRREWWRRRRGERLEEMQRIRERRRRSGRDEGIEREDGGTVEDERVVGGIGRWGWKCLE